MPEPDLHTILSQIEATLRIIIQEEVKKAVAAHATDAIELNETELEDNESANPFGWAKDPKLLRKLHELMDQYGLIKFKYEHFENAFFGKGKKRRLLWLKPTNLLVYFFTTLQTGGFIPCSDNVIQLLHENFLDKYGKVPTVAVLKSSLNQVNNKKAAVIDQILLTLSNFKV